MGLKSTVLPAISSLLSNTSRATSGDSRSSRLGSAKDDAIIALKCHHSSPCVVRNPCSQIAGYSSVCTLHNQSSSSPTLRWIYEPLVFPNIWLRRLCHIFVSFCCGRDLWCAPRSLKIFQNKSRPRTGSFMRIGWNGLAW